MFEYLSLPLLEGIFYNDALIYNVHFVYMSLIEDLRLKAAHYWRENFRTKIQHMTCMCTRVFGSQFEGIYSNLYQQINKSHDLHVNSSLPPLYNT